MCDGQTAMPSLCCYVGVRPKEERKKMSSKSWRKVLNGARTGLAELALLQFSVVGHIAQPAQGQEDGGNHTSSPIKHVIVIVGENRSFDHVFATYQPKKGESVDNLLSKG